MPVTEAQVLEALRPVQDPELHRSIVDLDMVRGIAIDGAQVGVTIALTVAGCPLRNEIQNRVTGAVTALDGVDGVGLDFTVMTDEERTALRTKLHGDPGATAGTHQAHGVDPVEGGQRPGHPVLDLVAQRAAGHGERDRDPHLRAVDGDAPHHFQVDDAPVELGILDGAKGLEDLRFGDGHGAPGRLRGLALRR